MATETTPEFTSTVCGHTVKWAADRICDACRAVARAAYEAGAADRKAEMEARSAANFAFSYGGLTNTGRYSHPDSD